MKKSYFCFLLCAVLTLAAVSPGFGAGRKKKEPPTPPPQPTIVNVAPTSITVADANATKTYTISQFTEIIVNAQKATVADLKPGMVVAVALGTDPTKASRITATDSKGKK